MSTQKTLRVCEKGHRYYKSSDCPSCPDCERERAPDSGFLSKLSVPARQALEHENILNLQQLATWSKKEVLALHGIGPASIPVLEKELAAVGLRFRKG